MIDWGRVPRLGITGSDELAPKEGINVRYAEADELGVNKYSSDPPLPPLLQEATYWRCPKKFMTHCARLMLQGRGLP